MERPRAASPAESIMSVATTATGTKRKERDFDTDVAGGEETNINVVVRCRGRNEREVKENSAVVVNTEGAKGQLVTLSMGANALSNKTYNFDRVFSNAADQSMVFEETVRPIVEEVSLLTCTIARISGYDQCLMAAFFRCLRATTAQSLPTDKLERERRTLCPAT
jgi:kinesin family member 11